MRLVCPNCVAQYEVADGTIPESGRDVQCANCNHIWFQDAAFKLSTDDLTFVPQKRAVSRGDGDDEADAPGVFHSQRAARRDDTPAEAAERALPEVGGNVLDILRSEAAFSSRRRAEARAEQPEPDEDDDDAGAFHHRIGTRAGDIAPEQEQPEPEEPAAEEPESDFRRAAWRHFGNRTDDATSTEPDEAPEEEYEEEYPAETGYADAAEDLTEDTEETLLDDGLAGLHADEAKRIADAAVARSAQMPEEPQINAEDPDESARQAIRRVSVRSLAVPPEETDAPESEPLRRSQPDAFEDEVATLEDEGSIDEDATAFDTDEWLPEDTDEASDIEADAEIHARLAAETDTEEEPEAEPEQEADTGPDEETLLAAAANPDDIQQVRRSLVENRKVLLPDVEELNTSLRMEKPESRVDLRSSAFSEEDIANRNRFWLGLVTALMLFGIMSALYLMGPAISDAFPAADPYVAEFRSFVDMALDVTAKALEPVVDWLEAL